MESNARIRACKQYRFGVYSADKLRLFLCDGRALLRILGQPSRDMAVCQHGVRLGRYDVYSSDIQPHQLQADGQCVDGRNSLVHDLHNDDRFGFGQLHSDVARSVVFSPFWKSAALCRGFFLGKKIFSR